MIETWMGFLLLAIICQRLLELIIARNNERWMKSKGGVEKGAKHYKWFIILHGMFFISIICEVAIRNMPNMQVNLFLLFLFIIVQAGRVWCIHSLGRFWNTKVIVLPGVALIKKGPYKYVKHPNYIIVAIELFLIPLLFKAYLTAFLFPVFHLILLKLRIPSEEKALAKASQ